MQVEENNQHIAYFDQLPIEKQKDLFDRFILKSQKDNWEVRNKENGSLINIMRVRSMFKNKKEDSDT